MNIFKTTYPLMVTRTQNGKTYISLIKQKKKNEIMNSPTSYRPFSKSNDFSKIRKKHKNGLNVVPSHFQSNKANVFN